MTNSWQPRKFAESRVWQLPMFAEYAEQISSDVADIKNIGEGRWGGAITGAKFLENFVGQRPWVHADIAGPPLPKKPKAWLDARRHRLHAAHPDPTAPHARVIGGGGREAGASRDVCRLNTEH